VTDRTYNIGSGQTYATIAAAASTAQSETTGSDTAIFLLHDSTFVGTTLLNFAAGATVIVRANTPFDGKFGGGSKIITSQLSWGNASAGSCTFRMEGLWADGNDWSGFLSSFVFSVGGTADQTLQFVNCGARNPKANWRPFRWQAANVTRGQIATFENCVFNDVGPETIRVDASTGATQVINFKGCTFADSRFLFGRSASHSLTVNATGCIFDPDASNALITTSGSGGTLALNAEGCAFSEAQATVEALWVVDEACVFSVGMVTGTPTSGQIGFTDLDGDDLSLVADANNAAIGLAAGLSMPATDIEGTTRDGSPDAGAFEAPPLTSPPDAPTGFTAGAITHNSLTFTWTDVATDETGYKVEYKEAISGTWLEGNYALPANTTSYTRTGLVPETLYDFRIAAFNDDGDSSWLTGQMTTDAAPEVTARPNRGGLSLGLGLGLGGRRSGGSASASSTLLWSSASSWDSGVPGPGDDVTIPAGTTIVLDTTTAALGTLTVEGTLQALQGATIGIEAQLVYVEDGGTLRIGSEAEPFTGTCTITLTGATPTAGQYITDGEDGSKLYNGMKRALMCADGGTVELHGTPPTVTKTRIGAHIDVSVEANEITLSEPVTWRLNDKIALSKTDFYAVGETELLTVASDVTNSTTVPVVENIATDRWGLLQYATDSGMSLTAGTLTREDEDTPTTLDERAVVIHLTRNIVIQGKDDTSWSTDKFGGHTMVEPPAEVIAPADPVPSSAVWRVEGVEFRRMGQQHFKGRYPIHFHMLSFGQYIHGDSGVEYGDVPAGAIYVRDCSVWDSSQRAAVIHGTCGVELDGIVAYDIEAHAFFEEDGAEERNTITNCAVMKVRDPGSGKRIKTNDEFASGFWLTNPNNTITHNYASDCQGRGFWNSFASQAFGLSRDVDVDPRQTVILAFDDNESHSNLLQGFRTEGPMTNEAGDTGIGRYLDSYDPVIQEFTMSRNISWKNTKFGYENRVGRGRYNYWTMADNDGDSDFFGSSLYIAKNRGPLLIHTSLNNANVAAFTARNAVASYHFEMDFIDLVAIGYEAQTPTYAGGGAFVFGGGVFGTGDLYTGGLFWQFGRNPGWTLINSHPGLLPKSPQFDGFAMYVGGTAPNDKYRYWTLGFVDDAYGYWYPAEPGRAILPDRDLYTYGLSVADVVDTDFVATSDPIYSVTRIQFDEYIGYGNSRGDANVVWHRLDTNNVSIDSHEIGDPAKAQFFWVMGSFAANQGGRFKLEFKSYDLTTIDEISIWVELAHLTTNTFLIGVPWDGGRTPSRVSIDSAGPSIGAVGRSISLTGTSIADVLADTSGQTAYQETGANIVWVLWKGLTTGTFDHLAPLTTESNSTVGTYTQFLRVTA
jgi:hypothetical protein